MRVCVTDKQAALIKNQARVPNRRTAAEKRQYHFRDHRFKNEQQRRIDEQSYRKENGQVLIQTIILSPDSLLK